MLEKDKRVSVSGMFNFFLLFVAIYFKSIFNFFIGIYFASIYALLPLPSTSPFPLPVSCPITHRYLLSSGLRLHFLKVSDMWATEKQTRNATSKLLLHGSSTHHRLGYLWC